MTNFQLGQLVYSADIGETLRLYIFEPNGMHRGGIFFRKIPRHPEEEISAEDARKLVDRAILDGKEVRVTNSGDHLVFHFKDDELIHPESAAAFWARIFA